MSEEIAQLRREIVDLRTESQTDPLTGLGNRRFFLAALDRSIVECRATNEPLTLLIADVDRIKSINENYGNIVGDRVLRFIAMVIKEGDHRPRRRRALCRRCVRDHPAEDQPAAGGPHRRAASPCGPEVRAGPPHHRREGAADAVASASPRSTRA